MLKPGALRDIERQITERLAAPPEDSLESLGEALAPLRSPSTVSRLLELVLEDEEALAAIAARSYFHVNGFDKLILLSAAAPEHELRLHIWWPEAEGADEHGGAFRSHNHRWDYSSYLLTGSLHIRHFESAETPAGQEMYLYRYFPPGRGAAYVMQALGTGSLRCVFDSILSAGDHYSLSRRVQHSVCAQPGHTVASLVLRGAAVEPDTLVFAEAQITTSEWIPVRRLQPDVVASRLERLLAELDRVENGRPAP